MGGPHKKSRSRSKITTELPKAVLAQAHRLLMEGTTYEDMEVWSKSQGYDISRSAWGRHGKQFFEAYQSVLQFEEQSRALTSAAGDGLNMEEALSKLLLQKIYAAVTDGEFDITEIPRLLSDFAKLQSSNISREKLKDDYAKQAREEALNDAADAVGEEAKAQGMSEDQAEFWRKKVLGVK